MVIKDLIVECEERENVAAENQSNLILDDAKAKQRREIKNTILKAKINTGEPNDQVHVNINKNSNINNDVSMNEMDIEQGPDKLSNEKTPTSGNSKSGQLKKKCIKRLLMSGIPTFSALDQGASLDSP